MQLQIDDNFPYPTFFMIAGRASGGTPAVEPVGVVVVKQTRQLNGTIDVGAQEAILMSDVLYEDNTDTEDPESPHFGHTHLKIRLESDLAAYKPLLDTVAVRNSFEPGAANAVQVRIDRGAGFLPNPPLIQQYGWRDRLTSPRVDEAGDVENFEPVAITDPANPPSLVERLKLPDGYQNRFWNGGRLGGLAHLQAGDRVEFVEQSNGITRRVTVPGGPTLAVTVDGAPIVPPVTIDLHVDTVVYDIGAAHFLITWRAIFAWQDRLSDTVLEVS